ncbi:MAG: GNAT family N-acetyltransferase [Betaproteobacteria bacterium]|nr:GNAT family N-acetyltransferase [Betaproteobacteria bacterium]
MIHFAFHRPPLNNPQVEKLLNSAFSVGHYAENFPHIFSANSGAFIATASTAQGEIKGLCAVDSEFWSEPVFMRGACIGSVAVDPSAQGQGLGRALLAWVLEQLAEAQLHDFVYLFSQPREFYGALGFVAAGREGLFKFNATPEHISLPAELRFVPPREISQLESATRLRVWSALERGRRAGESQSSWVKFESLCSVSGLLLSWLEGADGEILAGACIGKGIDFKGVMHTFFAESDALASAFLDIFFKAYPTVANELLIAPGLWSEPLKMQLLQDQSQTLCLVRGFSNSTRQVVDLFAKGRVYPRSLFSS